MRATEGKDHLYGSPNSNSSNTSQDTSEHKGAKRTCLRRGWAGLGSAEKAVDVAMAKGYYDDDDYN